jgi:hypothetical protein
MSSSDHKFYVLHVEGVSKTLAGIRVRQCPVAEIAQSGPDYLGIVVRTGVAATVFLNQLRNVGEVEEKPMPAGYRPRV